MCKHVVVLNICPPCAIQLEYVQLEIDQAYGNLFERKLFEYHPKIEFEAGKIFYCLVEYDCI